ncbi:hypothetical protein [Amycolatopsis sp. NPDC059021]|uniref:hypothetical protein n=1 Tax=Amycolatopsis sp. NPDC059021 TaxID=3346704 RepID=UPI0036731B15
MISNMKLTNPGTLLSCAANTAQAQRQGTDVFVSAHAIRGTRRIERLWATVDTTFVTATAEAGAYPQVVVDLPTIKQFRVPLSIRERSS